MKVLRDCCVVALAVTISSCAIVKGEGPSCADVDVVFLSSAPNEWGYLEGVFSITNNGRLPVELPMERELGSRVHARYVSTEERSQSGGGWRLFNPLLDEMLAPSGRLVVLPGQRMDFRSDANGLFVNAPRWPGNEYSIVLSDVDGCKFRSEPFLPQ